jgi:4-amino-4-deoxy-L-arabinose transferase-like glycosyltransferase
VLLAAAFRTSGLFHNTFHADEALFATWARLIAVWRDPLLANQLVDKPPLLFYLQAMFYPLMGPEMWVARIPSFIASLLVIPMTAVLAWKLYRNEFTMVLAAAFITFSPMAIQFSASGFIDPLMTFLVVSSLAATAGYVPGTSNHAVSNTKAPGRLTPTYAGVLYGLALASKFQAVLFLPLVLGLALSSSWKKSEWTRWSAGLLPIIGLLIIWQVARGAESNLIETQFRSYGGVRLAWSWELWPRLQEWAELWRQIIGSQVLEFMVLLSIPPFVALLIEQRDRSATLDRLFTLYVVAYLALHWFLALPVWDRYLLPLLPFIGLVLARFVWRVVMFAWPTISETLKLQLDISKLTIGVLVVFFALQAPAVIEAYRGQLPVGTSPGADEGAAEISGYLVDEPSGTVLYDHWYSWQWRYHLFDKRVYISWFPHPDSLVEDLRVFAGDGSDRYLALPNSDQSAPVRRMLDETGFSLTPVATTGDLGEHTGIVLYLVKPQ